MSSASGGPAPASLPVPAYTAEGMPQQPWRPGRRGGGAPWGLPGSLTLLVVFVLSQFGAAAGVLALLESSSAFSGAESMRAMTLKLGLPVTVIGSHAITWLAFYLLVIRRYGATAIEALGFVLTRRRPMLLAFGGGVAVQLLGMLLVWLVPPPPDYEHPMREFLLLGTWAILLVFLFAVIMAPLLEEVLFRGMLLPALRRRFAFPVSALVVTVLFTAMHVGQSGSYWPPLVGIFACGWALALWRERSGSLWPPIAFHIAFNLTALLPIIVLDMLGYSIEHLAMG